VSVTIRELRPGEWREARDLRLRALADAPTAFLRSLAEEAAFSDADWRERAAASDDRCSFVAEADGELVGMAAGIREPDAARVTLVGMWVDPARRRRAVGRELVEAVVAWARSRGVAEVALEVNEGLAPAVALYERCGFVPTGGRRALPTDPGRDAIELRLPLE
jgi:GNAT superfamily N-acetyltransferase